jgi:hypothetical protein
VQLVAGDDARDLRRRAAEPVDKVLLALVPRRLRLSWRGRGVAAPQHDLGHPRAERLGDLARDRQAALVFHRIVQEAAIASSSEPSCSRTRAATAIRWAMYRVSEPLRVCPWCSRSARMKARAIRLVSMEPPFARRPEVAGFR